MNAPALPVALPATGIGLLTALPSPSTNGTPLSFSRPGGAQAVRFYLGSG